ncbi:MAG: hypothetical protein WAN11_25345 [Syntrophobacteraceae bacterium]
MATGIFQHIASTWKELGGTDQDRLDASRQVQLGVVLAKQNAQVLAKDLGREPQPWEVYLAHQQGVGGAMALIHADPDASAASVLGGSTDKLTLNAIPADATASQALISFAAMSISMPRCMWQMACPLLRISPITMNRNYKV